MRVDLDGLKALEEKASKGLWKYGGPVSRDKIAIKAEGIRLGIDCGADINSMPKEYFEIGKVEQKYPPAVACAGKERDAALVVAMRNALPSLIAELEAARAVVELARKFDIYQNLPGSDLRTAISVYDSLRRGEGK